jgi:hypothetical protein
MRKVSYLFVLAVNDIPKAASMRLAFLFLRNSLQAAFELYEVNIWCFLVLGSVFVYRVVLVGRVKTFGVTRKSISNRLTKTDSKRLCLN